MTAILIVGLALGMRHGTDPDHLAAIDGLTRIRPRAANGVYFALGHGTVVILLAVGIGHIVAARFAFLGPWTLIAIGIANLWRLVHARRHVGVGVTPRPVVAQPLILGMLLAAGFETSSQLSALILAGQTNPWFLGVAFSGGMVLVDGLDGLLATATQRRAIVGERNAIVASRVLGILVVAFTLGLGGAEIAGIDLGRFALPIGLALFTAVVGIRIWARSESSSDDPKPDADEKAEGVTAPVHSILPDMTLAE